MKVMIAIVATLLASTVSAQSRVGSSGPFTGYEAEALSEVWPEIREAANFGDINWRAHGLQRAPGSPEAQRFLAAHWDEARQAERFGNIDWDELAYRGGSDYRSRSEGQRSRDAGARDSYAAELFTREEAATMSRLWPRIREAARYDDIDWRALGAREPGDDEAQHVMATQWGQLREAARFEDIDWEATLASSRTRVYR